MSEILRYQPVHEDAMVREDDGEYVKYEDHERLLSAANKIISAYRNYGRVELAERKLLVGAIAGSMFGGDADRAIDWLRAVTNPEEGA